MGKYRKKPVVIEAVEFTDESFEECVRFLGHSVDLDVRKEAIIIQTLEGPLNASLGDWIIKGVKGEFYPCKPDIFEQTYDKVEEKV